MSASSTVLYIRLPGLIALTARESRGLASAVPVAVASERNLIDVCPQTFQQGIRVGESVIRARRLCPTLFVVAQEDVDTKGRILHLLDALACLSPTVEPDGMAAAYTDITGGTLPDVPALLSAWDALRTGFTPLVGIGPSRIAARACAECALPSDCLSQADVRWLWPEDAKISARLFRLGISTFGAVASLGEAALVYQFGKIGRLIYQRSIGIDFMPIRALWPPHLVEVVCDFDLEPIADENRLSAALTRSASQAATTLRDTGRHARCLYLSLKTENGIEAAEWILPAPVQSEREIVTGLRRLRQQLTLTSAVLRIRILCKNLDLPPAATASLFDERAVERKLAIAAARQRLHTRYGIPSLRMLGEIPIPRRERRQTLRKARQQA